MIYKMYQQISFFLTRFIIVIEYYYVIERSVTKVSFNFKDHDWVIESTKNVEYVILFFQVLNWSKIEE